MNGNERGIDLSSLSPLQQAARSNLKNLYIAIIFPSSMR